MAISTDSGSGVGAGLRQGEHALSRAADLVGTTRGDVTRQCAQLGDRMAGLSGQWGGQGAVAFQRLMVTWQDRQRTILDALGDLATALQETERDTVATDQAQADVASRLQSRLG